VEKHVKERLVGAAVLAAAAIILVPEMLSGPGGARQKTSVRGEAAVTSDATADMKSEAASGSLKTYSIDLNQNASRQPAASATPSEPTPEPMEAMSATQPEAAKEPVTTPTVETAPEKKPDTKKSIVAGVPSSPAEKSVLSVRRRKRNRQYGALDRASRKFFRSDQSRGCGAGTGQARLQSLCPAGNDRRQNLVSSASGLGGRARCGGNHFG